MNAAQAVLWSITGALVIAFVGIYVAYDPQLYAGMFITAPVAAMPELFATWNVSRSGQVTSGVTSVIGDYAVTLTVALVPLAMVTVPVENFRLMAVKVGFVAAMPILYAACIYFSGRRIGQCGFQWWQWLCSRSH